MVKITNGVTTCEVTRGAFDGIYSKQGYKLVENKQSTVNVDAQNAVDAQSPDEKFCEEILEKPLAQWNKDETKKFAELKGIDITGTKNANEAKERIKAFLADAK